MSEPPTQRPPPKAPGPALASWSLRHASELATLRARASKALHQHQSHARPDGHDGASPFVQHVLLVLTELSTNALRYGGGAATITLHRLRDAWLIEVRDTAAHAAPVLYPPAPGHIGRNGLLITDKISAAWGWYHPNIPDQDTRPVKHVWAAIPDHAPSTNR